MYDVAAHDWEARPQSPAGPHLCLPQAQGAAEKLGLAIDSYQGAASAAPYKSLIFVIPSGLQPARNLLFQHPRKPAGAFKMIMFRDLAKVPKVVKVGLDRVATAPHIEYSFHRRADDPVMLWSYEAKND